MVAQVTHRINAAAQAEYPSELVANEGLVPQYDKTIQCGLWAIFTDIAWIKDIEWCKSASVPASFHVAADPRRSDNLQPEQSSEHRVRRQSSNKTNTDRERDRTLSVLHELFSILGQ
jgi:hypothetical protein